jgi:hypothetical protein
MSNRTRITLSAEQRAELARIRSHHAKRYVRERAAAILQVADGKTVADVSRRGLIRHRQDETVSEWVQRYRDQGVQGLEIQAGRGRKRGKPLVQACKYNPLENKETRDSQSDV